jgi:glycosyltransferase involved in cell wall biosynthesis
MKNRFLILASYSDSIIPFRGEFIKNLISRNIEVHIASPNLTCNSKIPIDLIDLGCKVHNIYLKRTSINPFFDLLYFIRLLFLINDIHPKYVMAYTIKPIVYGLIASKINRVNYRIALITGLGYAFTKDNKQSNFKNKILFSFIKFLYRLSLSTSNKIFFQNNDDKELFSKLNIIGRNNFSFVVNGSGVCLKSFNETPLSNKNIHFLLISRLLVDKGIREYVSAADIIRTKYPSVVFSLAGWIDENPNSISISELEDWISSKKISYMGKLSDVRSALKSCSVFVLPSYREGTPRTVLEAMAIGRAIITTTAPGCKETVIDGLNGYLVAPKSIDDLVKAFEKLINNPEFLISMGKESRKYAEKKFNVLDVNNSMIKFIGI